ncbi:APOBEC1 complementation factor, partial [Schistosoma japonicum]
YDSEPRTSCGVFIRNIPRDCCEDELVPIFELVGNIYVVCLSIDNYRLFTGGIAKTKSKDNIMLEMLKVTDGVSDVIVYPSVVDKAEPERQFDEDIMSIMI